MAAVDDPGIEILEDQILRVKVEIETNFAELMDYLEKRKQELLQQLEELSVNFKREKEMYNQSLSELERMIKLTQETVQSDKLKHFQSNIVQMTAETRKETESEWNSKRIIFDWDRSILDLAENIGKLNSTSSKTSSLPLLDYEGKEDLVVRIGKQGKGNRQFDAPYGLAIEPNSGDIFVSDSKNHRVQVFNSEGKYQYKFGHQDGDGEMNETICIAIFKERVFVGQRTDCVLVYELDGTFIAQIGRKGSGEGDPGGIAIDVNNEDIYVCDYNNHRVQIFSNDFRYKNQFGQGIVYHPQDIILANDEIYILTTENPFLFLFNSTFFQRQKYHFLSYYSIPEHLVFPYAFTLDRANNLIISDNIGKFVIVLNSQGKLIKEFMKGITQPRGLSVDSKGRLVLINEDSLLIF